MIVLSLFKGEITLPPPPRTMNQIILDVARRHDLTAGDLLGPSQARRYAHPRQEAMWEMRQVMRPNGSHRYSTTMIGRALGGRDHSTVSHGAQRHESRIAERWGRAA